MADALLPAPGADTFDVGLDFVNNAYTVTTGDDPALPGVGSFFVHFRTVGGTESENTQGFDETEDFLPFSDGGVFYAKVAWADGDGLQISEWTAEKMAVWPP